MFTFSYDEEYDSATLHFKNELLEIECCPENCADLFEDSYDSAPSNGEFRFHYDKDKIVFNVAKYGNGQGGCLTLVFKMTKEILNSLEEALKEWRSIILKRKEDKDSKGNDNEDEEDEDNEDEDKDEDNENEDNEEDEDKVNEE